MTCPRGGRRILDEAERALVGALGGGDMAPFLGHYALPTQVGKQLQDEIRRGVGRIEKRLRLLFYCWPALTTAWIARTVAERYGTIAQMEVYPHLSALFGVPNLDPTSRIRIAKLFRHACTRLDLPLPETGEAVDAYVVQAGVPHAQIDRLADALIKAERRVGLPDIDDDAAVAMFTEVAANAVDAGHPRLRKVLEHDAVGWYARLWTVLREHPEEIPDDAFARLLANAASNSATGRSPSLKRPCLAWRDGLLSVEVPEGQGRRWTLAAADWRQEVMGQAAPVAAPLPLPWPAFVEWRGSGLVRRSEDAGRLEPPSPESVGVFGANGRLVAMARFSLPEEAPQSVRLARGPYDLVGGACFLGLEGLEPDRAPGGWHLRIEVGEEAVALRRGDRSAILSPVRRPELELHGRVIRDLHGRPIYADQGVSVRVIWPIAEEGQDESDLHGDAADTSPVGFHRLIDGTHELLVEIPDKELPPLPIDLGPTGEAVLDLGRHLIGIGPVLRRVVLKLVRRGERRPLARTAAFLWFGLERSDGRRFAGRRPTNLSVGGCLNLDLDKGRVALRADQPYATARLVVDDVDGKGRRELFEFAYPGLLAVLRWLDADGVWREEVLERDGVVALRPGDSRLLEVSSPDSRATLVVGVDVRAGAFAHRPRVGIPLATVAEACRGGADRLAVRGSDGLEVTLARFTVPCEVTCWVETHDSMRAERALLLGFREPLDRLRIRARDIWQERTATLELMPDGLRRGDGSGIALRLESDHSGPESRVRLIAELHHWLPGLWLCELEAQLGTDIRWQALSNVRGDAFAWLVPNGVEPILAGDLATTLIFAERVRIFASCHKRLQRCFAQPCWEGGVKMVLHLWHRLAASIAADQRLARYWPAILPLAFVEPPLEASESWLPLVSFWNVLPEFMALPGPAYTNLRGSERDDAAVLALLADIAEAGSVAQFLQRYHLLDVDFFGCFANLAEVSQSQGQVECRGFRFKSYAERVRRTAEEGDALRWSIGEPVLSSSHYLTAFESLVRRYRTLTSGRGNAERIPGAARLVHHSLRWLDREGRALAEGMVSDLILDGTSLALPVPINEQEDVLLQDAPTALSAVALACRLEARRPGTLDAFINSLAGDDRDREAVAADLNFLTAAGRDLFAFWLLFWDLLLTTGERCKT